MDPALERIYERAVAKDLGQRFASIEELASAIRAVPAGEPIEISGIFTPSRVDSQPELGELEPTRERSWRDAGAGFLAALLGTGVPARGGL